MDLTAWLNGQSITLFHPPITLFRRFINQLKQSDFFPAMRQIMLGGDVLFRRDLELAKNHFSEKCLFVHQYAASETGLIANHVISRDYVFQEPIIPAGFPVPGKEIRIIDESGEEVGFNQVGQIIVRSRFLSPGYWNLPEETIRKFSSGPDNLSEPFYMTGDLGRIRPDGMLQYFGRFDSSVKVRGFRIELATIEAAILELGAQDVIVKAQIDLDREKHLVAYLVPGDGFVGNSTSLRHKLVKKLPDYMVPTYFCFLPELPRLANGKIDSHSLPNPLQQNVQNGGQAESRELLDNPIEKELFGIITSVLRIDTIGRNDNIFVVGCNSILAAEIVTNIARHFQVEFTLREIYENPTLAEMANSLQVDKRRVISSEKSFIHDNDVLDYLSQFV